MTAATRALLIAFVVASATTVAAQDGEVAAAQQDDVAAEGAPADAVANKAQQLFDDATEKLRVGNAAAARDLLRRSLALHSRIPTRYNLGVALRRSGQTIEAIDTFQGLLRETTLSPAHRDVITNQLQGAESELATIIVRVTGAELATIELDAREVGEAGPKTPLTLRVNAGERVVLARAGGTSRQRVRTVPGETAQVTLHVISVAERQRADKKKRRKRRAGWATGGVAIAVAAVVTAVVTSQRSTSTTADPVPGHNDRVFSALRQAR